MSEWETVRIADEVAIQIGGTPSRIVPSFWAAKPAGNPWIAISDLKQKFIVDTEEYITEQGARFSNVKKIPAGTTVMSFKLSVGRTGITTRPMFCNEAIAIFLPRSEKVNSRWLFHALPRAVGTVFADTAVKGVTLNKAKMAEMRLNLPSPTEQCYIAEALDTLDSAIQKTEAIVEKLKQVKQGLLHDLLTRGVDANGELRPSPEQAPELYQDSAVGQVPTDWEVQPLGNALLGIDAGWSPSCPEEPPKEGEWGVLKVSAVSGGFFHPLESKRLPKGLRPIPTIEVRQGDVILARANGVADLVATTVYVDATPRGLMLSDKTLRLNPNPSRLTGRFLAAIMQTSATRAQIGGMLNGSSGQKNISQSQLKNLVIAIPSVSEQKSLELHLKAAEQRVHSEQVDLKKLRAQKAGLMDDLLTGRVRVTPLLAASTP